MKILSYAIANQKAKYTTPIALQVKRKRKHCRFKTQQQKNYHNIHPSRFKL
jgi:hypothetical protein